MDVCEIRDDWSRQCLPPLFSALFVQAASATFCLLVGLTAGLFLAYVFCLRRTQRPKYRVLSFFLIVTGLVLSTPKVFIRILEPTRLAPEDWSSTHWIFHILFVVGDILDHAGLLGTIYWDICTEAVLLVFALDPAQKARSLSLCFKVGMGLALSQVLSVGIFLSAIVLVSDKEATSAATSVFYAWQLSLIFGIAPTFSFGLLARSLRSLRTRLPSELPKRLLHRLQYTQWGLLFFAIICSSFIPAGILPALVPFLNSLGGILYLYAVVLVVGFASLVLLLAELILTLKQLQHQAAHATPVDADRLKQLLDNGVQALASKSITSDMTPSTEATLPCGHGSDEGQVKPVWERGLEHSMIQAFLHLYRRDVKDDADKAKTHEVCQQLVKPATAAARCSAWEALVAGWQMLPARGHDSHCSHYFDTPTVMVSHCWATPFSDLLAIMKRYDENTSKSNFFFVDVLSMNQHDLSDLSGAGKGKDEKREVYDIMLEALTKSIQVPKRVLLALTPHERPLLLTRCWCLYEIYIAWKVGAEVSCGFVPQAEQKVILSLTQDDELITRMLATVDAEKSEATVESDRLMILSLIEEAGVKTFNQFVQKKLAASLRVVALTTVLHPNAGFDDEDIAMSPSAFHRSMTAEADGYSSGDSSGDDSLEISILEHLNEPVLKEYM